MTLTSKIWIGLACIFLALLFYSAQINRYHVIADNNTGAFTIVDKLTGESKIFRLAGIRTGRLEYVSQPKGE